MTEITPRTCSPRRPRKEQPSSRVQTDAGLAGELQRLIVQRRKRPLAQFVYKNAGVILQALRLVEE